MMKKKTNDLREACAESGLECVWGRQTRLLLAQKCGKLSDSLFYPLLTKDSTRSLSMALLR